MPIHDWSRVDAGIFHAYHHGWVTEISRALNRGLLPATYYALPEPIAGRPRPAKAVTIRHVSDHRAVARVEIVSRGNKDDQNGLNAFREAREALAAGVHLLVIDLFAPSPRDPQRIHLAMRGEVCGDFMLPENKPLTCVAYRGGVAAEAFVDPVAVGDPLPEMPLFLTAETYVLVPLEATYRLAWEGMPEWWRNVLTTPPT